MILVDTSVWVEHRIEGLALIGNARLWTRDRRLRQVASELAVGVAVP